MFLPNQTTLQGWTSMSLLGDLRTAPDTDQT